MARSAFARAFTRALSYRWRFSALALMCSLAAIPCAASEIVVKNDSMPPSQDRVLDLPASARIGAWLTSPVQGTIVGIQILWGSPDGGAPPSQEAAIRISEFDFPNGPLGPGNTLATIANPVLLDGQLNEFRFLDAGSDLVPLSVPVPAGRSFFVDLELANAADEDNSPGILMDLDYNDAEPYRNLALVPPLPNWFNIGIGVAGAGDFVIRAIIQPVPEPSSMVLLGAGAIGVVIAGGRCRKRPSPT